jgi:predicted DCC family thiol-disulfide oxidoreductase YuxK
MIVDAAASALAQPILLFNGECAVCRTIATWVKTSSRSGSSTPSVIEQPIGDDPVALRVLNPNLDIWDAYETIHILMPDGSMKLGGEAVAEVLRRLPNCAWFSWMFDIKIAGIRPFQLILNLGYVVLADVRPLLGCESCGISSPWVKFVGSIIRRVQGKPAAKARAGGSVHFTSPAVHKSRPATAPGERS